MPLVDKILFELNDERLIENHREHQKRIEIKVEKEFQDNKKIPNLNDFISTSEI